VCICRKYASDEDALYGRLDSLLVEFPDWTLNAQSKWLNEYFATPYTILFAPVPVTDAGRTLLVEHGGVGPIKTALKVMKRLYDEGRGFLDMEKTITNHVKSWCKSVGRPQKEKAPQLRILAHLFPKCVDGYKVQIAGRSCSL
jgi:hypothetical protein